MTCFSILPCLTGGDFLNPVFEEYGHCGSVLVLFKRFRGDVGAARGIADAMACFSAFQSSVYYMYRTGRISLGGYRRLYGTALRISLARQAELCPDDGWVCDGKWGEVFNA